MVRGVVHYLDGDLIIIEVDGEKLLAYPYRGCNSGFWYMRYENLSEADLKSLPLKLRENSKNLTLHLR
jgi:ribosomal protein S6